MTHLGSEPKTPKELTWPQFSGLTVLREVESECYGGSVRVPKMSTHMKLKNGPQKGCQCSPSFCAVVVHLYIPYRNLEKMLREWLAMQLSRPRFPWQHLQSPPTPPSLKGNNKFPLFSSARPSQGGLFAAFGEKVGDPLKKESFTTRGSNHFFHKRWQKDPSWSITLSPVCRCIASVEWRMAMNSRGWLHAVYACWNHPNGRLKRRPPQRKI